MASSSPHPRSSRRGSAHHGAPQRSSSFHGRSSGSPGLAPSEPKQMRRPKTQPELLDVAAWRKTSGSSSSPSAGTESNNHNHHVNQTERRLPSKILVNVNIQRSLGALQVMAPTEWTVGDLIAASVKQYAKECRRPLLTTADPTAYALHYSQFSLECLDPKEKLIGLGSRNFFLCPRSSSALTPSSSAHEAAPTSCSDQVEKASKITIPWLRSILKSLPSA